VHFTYATPTDGRQPTITAAANAFDQASEGGLAAPTNFSSLGDRMRRRVTALLDWLDERWSDNEELAGSWPGHCWLRHDTTLRRTW
jgi:hypothetical protein